MSEGTLSVYPNREAGLRAETMVRVPWYLQLRDVVVWTWHALIPGSPRSHQDAILNGYPSRS